MPPKKVHLIKNCYQIFYPRQESSFDFFLRYSIVSNKIKQIDFTIIQYVPRIVFGSAVVTLYTLSSKSFVHYKMIRTLFEAQMKYQLLIYIFPLYICVKSFFKFAFFHFIHTCSLYNT